MAGELLLANGVDGATGGYVLPEVEASVVGRLARGERLDDDQRRQLATRFELLTAPGISLKSLFDPTDLSSCGWGVVFADDADPAVTEALAPLLARRNEQAGDHYRSYTGAAGHRAGETASRFVERHGGAPGHPPDPEKMPYYLLVVGDAERVPFWFQYQLGVTHAVGRLSFDTPEDYAAYAAGVLAAERATSGAGRAAFVGVSTPDDKATVLSAEHLVTPLARRAGETAPAWTVRTVVGADATKEALRSVFGGADRADLVFTAGHGMAFPLGDERQLRDNGALLTADWPGPFQWRKAIPPELYLGADDVGDDADVSGMVAFVFACFGAGTPRLDEFAGSALDLQTPPQLAPRSLVSRLPQRLLSHPRGPALAVIGHVERAWSYSFLWPRSGEQLGVFTAALASLLAGEPVGHAVEAFADLYASTTTALEDEKDALRRGDPPDNIRLSELWTARNDARNYVVLGDPAVRLPPPTGTAPV